MRRVGIIMAIIMIMASFPATVLGQQVQNEIWGPPSRVYVDGNFQQWGWLDMVLCLETNRAIVPPTELPALQPLENTLTVAQRTGMQPLDDYEPLAFVISQIGWYHLVGTTVRIYTHGQGTTPPPTPQAPTPVRPNNPQLFTNVWFVVNGLVTPYNVGVHIRHAGGRWEMSHAGAELLFPELVAQYGFPTQAWTCIQTVTENLEGRLRHVENVVFINTDGAVPVVIRQWENEQWRIVFFPDQWPIIVGNRTLLPVRYVMEPMGYVVTWNNSTRTAVVATPDGSRRIEIPIGQRFFPVYENNVRVGTIESDVAAQIINGRTLIPIRFLIDNWSGRDMPWFGGTGGEHHEALIQPGAPRRAH